MPRKNARPLRNTVSRLFTVVLASVLCSSLASCGCSKQQLEIPVNDLEVKDSTAPVDDTITWPLTGLEAANSDDIKRRPISVKIENTPVARPQLGISHADVIYESVTEGGITRFNCIFQSDIPAELGPVRSARNSDLSIVPQYQAMFFYSGANKTVRGDIANSSIDDMGNTPAQELYYRVDYREAPHNLYIKTEGLSDVAAGLGFATTLETPPSLEFGEYGTAAGTAATQVTVPLSDYYIATWDYDTATSAYLRSMDGVNTDAENEQQLAVTNVVVMWAPHSLGVIANKSQTYNIDLTTTGPASVFMGGKRIDGTWEASPTSPPRFKDASGQPLPLTPGKTWFEVVDTPVVVTAT